ncbi:MAG: hypothetical protein MUF15_26230, partial [Acidobacteria bacterium]|nr:hypothetical protein [Acidobacteriota bacterium]
GNSKFEYRNPKQISARETRKKHENKKAKRAIIHHSSFIIHHSAFSIQHSLSGTSIKTLNLQFLLWTKEYLHW